MLKAGLCLLSALASMAVAARTAGAHEFFAPNVHVFVSDRTPGGHPDLQTIIELDEGATFDEVEVVGPPGGSIAADLDIPDGTIVGRLDGVATTNAIVLPECDFVSTFAVTIREATTDTTSPTYPAYLIELAPGQHRLRLVADVSPSPDVPVLINYLFDIDQATESVVSHTIVGNPLAPPAQFRTCTPVTSKVTLFGRNAQGIVLLTNADPMPEEPSPYTYTFLSRPDESGHRHEETVEATAQVAAIDRGTPPAAPLDLRVLLFGATGRLEWTYDRPAESFEVHVLTTDLAGEGHQILEPFRVGGAERSFFLDRSLLPFGCSERVRFRVAAVDAAGIGAFAESEQIGGCVEGPENPDPNAVFPPDAGGGPRRVDHGALVLLAVMALVGSLGVVLGLIRRSPCMRT